MKSNITNLNCLLVLAALAFSGFATAETYTLPAPDSNSIVEVFIDCQGTGSPTVVIEVGLGASSEAWKGVQDLLKSDTRVCRYDRPGFGQSRGHYAKRTARNAAILLHNLLEASGEKGPFVLVGHSMGGIVVRMFYDLYPGTVAGIGFIDASHPDMCDKIPNVCPKPRNSSQEVVGSIVVGDDMNAERAYAMELATNAEIQYMTQNLKESRVVAIEGVPILAITRGRWSRTTSSVSKSQTVRHKKFEAWNELHASSLQGCPNVRWCFAQDDAHDVYATNPKLVANEIKYLLKLARMTLAYNKK